MTTPLNQDGDVDGGFQESEAAGWAWPQVYALAVNGNPGILENANWPAALRALSVSVSVALHVSLIVLAMFWISRAPGLIQEMSDAISVEMLLTNMTEQHEAEELSEVVEVPAQAAQAADPLPASELQAVEAQDAQPTPSASPELEDGMEALTGNAETDDAIGIEKHEDKPKEARPDAETRERKDRESERRKKSIEKRPSEAKPPEKRASAKPEKAAAAETDSAGSKAKAPRVSGSTGSVLNYGARVRAKVAGHVPRSGAGKGTAVVSFGVTPSGGLAYARISRSSGNAAIDRSVLAGVRASSPFPPPPAGASPSQLRFSASFQFR